MNTHSRILAHRNARPCPSLGLHVASSHSENVEAVRGFHPLADLILVLPDPAPSKIGSIFVPGGSLPQGHQPADDPTEFMGVTQRRGDGRDTFTGTVVAVGPGDRHKPAASLKCSVCHKKRDYNCMTDTYVCLCQSPNRYVAADPERPGFFINMPKRVFNEGNMYGWEAAEWDAGRYPMYTKVGDRVAFPRRPSSPVGIDEGTGNCDLHIGGVGYLLFHEEQSAFAIIDA